MRWQRTMTVGLVALVAVVLLVIPKTAPSMDDAGTHHRARLEWGLYQILWSRKYGEQLGVTLSQFVSECCVVAPGLRGRGLYPAYRQWAEENGLMPISAVRFSLRLQEKGLGKGRDRSGRYFDGIGLRA